MAARARCVHCLKPLEECTLDHVFPRSWYPVDTPHYVQRWTVPCCGGCNNKLSRVEQDLFVRLGLCMDPEAAMASGIAAKALRSLGVGTHTLSEKERSYREKLKEKIVAEFLNWEEVKGKPGVLPGFGPHSDFPRETQVAVPVPHSSLVALAEKIARGLEFQIAGRYVEVPYKIGTFFIATDAIEAMRQTVLADAEQEYFGPGFRVLRRAANDDPYLVLYEMLIWGALTIHVVIDVEEDARLTEH